MSEPSIKLMSALIKCGQSMPTSRPEAKPILDQVSSSVLNVLTELENAHLEGVEASFAEQFIPKVLANIHDTLQKFKKLDHENGPSYEKLLQRVDDCKSKKQASAVLRSSSPSGVRRRTESSSGDSDNPSANEFEGLTEEERVCLFCFCLFCVGKEVKKREPIHLWVGMDLVDSVNGYEMLEKLVAKGFIERTMENRRLLNRYKMKQHVYSMVKKEMLSRDQFLYIIDQKQPQQQQTDQNFVCMLGNLALKMSETTLRASIFEQISQQKKTVNLLHLGNWLPNSKRHIVIDEVETLKALVKHRGQLKFLSLEGVSGILELPDSIYMLENLKVLDLRGCPNLESLSKGIGSLKQLTHLDLSECYLLGFIPEEVESLTNLRVLKGFVINPTEVTQGGNEGGESEKTDNASLSASFDKLSNLKNLIKLTIRTRRMKFPDKKDIKTLCAMKKLVNLKIVWVSSSNDDPSVSGLGCLPSSLKKLELEAAPGVIILELLRRYSLQTNNSLEKLYIRGGQFWDLGTNMHPFRHVNIVRLRYLPMLRINWDEFNMFYPSITRLEIFECPNLIRFPCDENGVWEKK